MNFEKFSSIVRDNFNKMSKGNLYVVDCGKDEIFEAYLASFPEGSNPLYKERTEHDCQCCKHFIRDVGNVVSIQNGKLRSIWQLDFDDDVYSVVAKALADKVEGMAIKGVFKHYTNEAGVKVTRQLLESGEVINWNHFQCTIPRKHCSDQRDTVLSEINSKFGVYKRGLNEITEDALVIILDLIGSNSLYRGEEFKAIVKSFQKSKKDYDKAKNKDVFVWETFLSNKAATIKNTVIGTLLIDISEGKNLEGAVAAFESKVAPQNYKRTSSIITKRMVEDAMKTIDLLKIRDSLPRQYAKISDVSVNNVLFVDRSVKSKMKDSIADLLETEVKSKPNKNSACEEISVKDFIGNIVPKASSIKLLVENKHKTNLASLITPKHKEAPPILQWDNNFSWSYNGDVTDSIKEKVKKAGGDVTGIVRVSLSWSNKDDLDLHILEPNKNIISYNNKHSATSGKLDVDMNAHSSLVRDAVENITWSNRSKILKGEYTIKVHNYNKRENIDVGFEIEVECNGQLFTFNHNKVLRASRSITIAKFNFDGTNITPTNIHKDIEAKGKSTEVWNITTEKFAEVDTIMYSPNHWDGQSIGNKHYIFTLKGCKNPEDTRGLYNEFLRGDLTKHRKVFEILGSKMKCGYQDEQLSGVGFSSTKKNDILCEVQGEINKTYKILF